MQFWEVVRAEQFWNSHVDSELDGWKATTRAWTCGRWVCCCGWALGFPVQEHRSSHWGCQFSQHIVLGRSPIFHMQLTPFPRSPTAAPERLTPVPCDTLESASRSRHSAMHFYSCHVGHHYVHQTFSKPAALCMMAEITVAFLFRAVLQPP